jgi:hypothetical protein
MPLDMARPILRLPWEWGTRSLGMGSTSKDRSFEEEGLGANYDKSITLPIPLGLGTERRRESPILQGRFGAPAVLHRGKTRRNGYPAFNG